jgi:hypothetical protein
LLEIAAGYLCCACAYGNIRANQHGSISFILLSVGVALLWHGFGAAW